MPYNNPDSEDTLEQATIALFGSLGWQSVNAYHEWDRGPSTLGRTTRAEVVLTTHLRSVLAQLNPDLPTEALALAVEELSRDRSTMSPAAANRELYRLLKDGVVVTVHDADGISQVERVRVIDWANPANNDFLLVSQLWVTGAVYTRRTDLVGFVNGLPWCLLSSKRTTAASKMPSATTCVTTKTPFLSSSG